jgi:peptide/nickel transport system substrate-binding protein
MEGMGMQKLAVSGMVLVLCALAGHDAGLGEQPPVPQGELRIVDTREVFGFSVAQNVVEHLVEVDPEGMLVPRLATGWHWLDDRTLEVSLRPGVTFHNGEVFDAAIVKHNWDESLRLQQYWGADLLWWTFPPEASLTIIDPYTIRLVLPAPDAATLVKLGYIPMTNRQFTRTLALAGGPEFYWPTLFSSGPWGTGPYQWVHDSAPVGLRSAQVTLEANLAYWEPRRLPRLQRVVFDNTLARHDAAELVQSSEGRVDLFADLRPLDTLRVAQSPFAKVVKERGGLRNVLGLLNMRKAGSPWHDVRLRQAVNYAINREDLIQYAAKGNGVLIPALLPPRAFGYDPALAPYAFAPATAQRLLQEADAGHGLAITLIATEALEVQATVVSKMLEQVAFTVQRQLLDDATLPQAVSLYWVPASVRAQPTMVLSEKYAWDIALLTTELETSLASSFPTPVYRMYALDGEYDWVLEQPELRQLYEQVTHTSDRAQQQALIQQMERHTRDQAYFLFLYNLIQLYAVNKAVEFVPHPSGLLSLAETAVTAQHWSVREAPQGNIEGQVSGQK